MCITKEIKSPQGWELKQSTGVPGGMGEQYGPTFSVGDVIGVGMDNVTSTIFFTKNGKYLGMHEKPSLYDLVLLSLLFIQKDLPSNA